MALERVSLWIWGQQKPSSGYACGIKDFFLFEDGSGTVKGEGTVVFVTPVYCRLGAEKCFSN